MRPYAGKQPNLSWITYPHKKAGTVLTTCMLEKGVMVTPSLPRGKNIEGVDPVDNRPSTNKKWRPETIVILQ